MPSLSGTLSGIYEAFLSHSASFIGPVSSGQHMHVFNGTSMGRELSVVHRVLRISEIMNLICTLLRDDQKFDTLVSVALACSTLKDPAIDALWYDVSDACRLFSIMPLGIVREMLAGSRVRSCFSHPEFSSSRSHHSRFWEITNGCYCIRP